MKIQTEQMQMKAEAAETLLKALANKNRLMLMCQLIGGEKSVGELVEASGLRGPTVSQHLALLRKDGLVKTRREAQTIWYSIASEPARRIIDALYQYYCA